MRTKTCKYGNSCRFSHNSAQNAAPGLSGQTDPKVSAAGQNSPGSSPSKDLTCRFFIQQDKCLKGDRCERKHDYEARAKYRKQHNMPALAATKEEEDEEAAKQQQQDSQQDGRPQSPHPGKDD